MRAERAGNLHILLERRSLQKTVHTETLKRDAGTFTKSLPFRTASHLIRQFTSNTSNITPIPKKPTELVFNDGIRFNDWTPHPTSSNRADQNKKLMAGNNRGDQPTISWSFEYEREQKSGSTRSAPAPSRAEAPSGGAIPIHTIPADFAAFTPD